MSRPSLRPPTKMRVSVGGELLLVDGGGACSKATKRRYCEGRDISVCGQSVNELWDWFIT